MHHAMRYLSQDSCISGMGRKCVQGVEGDARSQFLQGLKSRMLPQGGRSAKRNGPQNLTKC